MPKVTKAHRQARRHQILTAAFTCFGRNGVHNTTMRDICEEAGLSAGAVYNYFDGKDDIIRAIGEESRESADVLFGAVDKEQSAPRELAALMQHLGRFAEKPGDDGHRVRVRLWSEALRVSDVRDVLRENQADLTERFSGIIREGQAKGEIAERWEPEALARALIAFYQGMVLQKTMDPEQRVEPVFEAMGALLCEAFE